MGWYEFLPGLLNMSMTASLIILMVLIVRMFLKKAPKVFSYALWAVVLFRLLCPVTIASDFSLLGVFQVPVTEEGATEYIPVDIVHTEYPQVSFPAIELGNETFYTFPLENMINEKLPQGKEQLAAEPLEAPVSIATYIWGLGVLVMVLYNLCQLVQIRRRLQIAECLEKNIYLADHLETPLVIGLVHPKIYLPSGLKAQERTYIILHEQYHIRRGDHLVKLLAFVGLCMHWFNPLVWLAFSLAVKDMEMSCDEAVMKQARQDIRAAYAGSLLQFAAGRQLTYGAPLAFGESDTKARVKNVMHYKKPAFWLVLAAILLCIVAVVCLVTNPKEEATNGSHAGQTAESEAANSPNVGQTAESEAVNSPNAEQTAKPAAEAEQVEDSEAYLATGNQYETRLCLYLTPLSSSMASNDSGDWYRIEEDAFVKVSKKTGEETRIQVEEWGWQPFPYTAEEWLKLYVPGGTTANMEQIEEQLATWAYQPIRSNEFLVDIVDEIWLVRLGGSGEKQYIWSIYSLRPAAGELQPLEKQPIVTLTLDKGNIYRTSELVSFSIMTQIYPLAGDSGYTYEIRKHDFLIQNKIDGSEEVIPVEKWGWQDLPYTKEQWGEMTQSCVALQNIHDTYEEILYQPISEDLFILQIDGVLLLVETISWREHETYIGEVFTMVYHRQSGNTHVVKRAYETYLEAYPEEMYPARDWVDGEGGLKTPFDWRERLGSNPNMSRAQNRAGYQVPGEALEQADTMALLELLAEWNHISSYGIWNYISHYLHFITSELNVAEELINRRDLAYELFAAYQEDNFYLDRSLAEGAEAEAYEEAARFQYEKIALEEILLASNIAYNQMNDEMRKEVLAEALEKVELRLSGRFWCSEKSADGNLILSQFPSGFFAYILEQEMRSGSRWYQYLEDIGETELLEKLENLSVRQCWP